MEGPSPWGVRALSGEFRGGVYSHVYLWGNEGCGGCESGGYELTHLAFPNENIITNVKVVTGETDDDDVWTTAYFLFVFYENEQINFATLEGTDGNGCYGSGFWVEVVPEGFDRDDKPWLRWQYV